MKVYAYIAGPMSGLPNFNVHAFDEAESWIEVEAWVGGYEVVVFNPASHDRKVHGEDFFDRHPEGSAEIAAKQGFSLRDALAADLFWICQRATDIVMLEGWENSKGARCEHALAVALGLNITYL